MTVSPVSRRSLLGLAAGSLAGIVVGGCSDSPHPRSSTTRTTGSTTPPTTTSEGGDVALVAAAITDEQSLVQVFRQARLAHLDLAAQLDPVIAVGRRHVSTLTAALDAPPVVDSSPPPALLPGSSAGAVRVLHQALLASQLRRSSDCLAAQSGAVARLMASIGAAHAASAAVLDTVNLGRKGRRG